MKIALCFAIAGSAAAFVPAQQGGMYPLFPGLTHCEFHCPR